MWKRMDMLLALCRKHGHKTLILGAWGCGVFQNDPADIARWFKELLFGKYKDQFARVVFSVYSRRERFILPFREHFEEAQA
ncbi:MAG: TIGR02452 family protein [Lewinellaceae bacterium]|nr:TIGR02452 family protein [Lewinellaceae bacterium]MCB9286683.1 TIGR02452 family protein [Lewinellaceae bacterium]